MLSVRRIGKAAYMQPYQPSGSLRVSVNVAAAHHGWTDQVFMLLDIKFSKSKKRNIKTPSLTFTSSEGVERNNF